MKTQKEKDKIKIHGKPGIIPQKLCRDPNISPVAKATFALLATYEQAYPSCTWLAQHVPCSRPTLSLALKELELHGWLLRERRCRNKHETNIYHIFLDGPIPVDQRPKWAQELIRKGLTTRNYLRHVKLTSLSKPGKVNLVKLTSLTKPGELEINKDIRQDKDTRQDKIKKILSESPEKAGPTPSPNGFRETAKRLLEYLNRTAGRKFQPTDKNLSLIVARLKEGFSDDDVRLVVDFKSAEWGDDPKMAQYVRPDTLFRPSKFPGYLAAAKLWDQQGRPPLNGHRSKLEDSLYYQTGIRFGTERGAKYYEKHLTGKEGQ